MCSVYCCQEAFSRKVKKNPDPDFSKRGEFYCLLICICNLHSTPSQLVETYSWADPRWSSRIGSHLILSILSFLEIRHTANTGVIQSVYRKKRSTVLIYHFFCSLTIFGAESVHVLRMLLNSAKNKKGAFPS